MNRTNKGKSTKETKAKKTSFNFPMDKNSKNEERNWKKIKREFLAY